MADMKMEKQIENMMACLECSREEAIDIIEQDKVIDKGGRTYFDLSKEQEKEAKKMANVHEKTKKPTVYNFDTTKKERKENVEKAGIIAALEQFLAQNESFTAENVAVLNKERQLSFTIGEETYELTLVQKRKPKK